MFKEILYVVFIAFSNDLENVLHFQLPYFIE